MTPMDTIKMPSYDPTDSGNKPGDGPLRVGGQPVTDPVRADDNLPSKRSKASSAQMPALQVMRDVCAGPERVRQQSTAYLPKAPGEQQDDYRDRLTHSAFHNFVGTAIEGMVGMIFRRDPVLDDDVPPVIAEHWESIDDVGTHGAVFAREVEEDALTAGHAAILVEFPRTDGRQTFRDEQGAIRPYWIPIKKEQILSWRTAKLAGQLVLTQLVIEEQATEPSGEFGETESVRYRIFNRDIESGIVSYRLLTITPGRQVVELEAGTYPTQAEIPVVEVPTSGRKGLFVSAPPLYDMAEINLEHYRDSSDYSYSRHKSNVPIFFTAGIRMPEGNLVLGANTAINAPDPGATAAYISHSGAAHADSQKAIDQEKADMATMGLAMLSPQTRAAETAEARRIDKSATDSALAVDARGLQDALEKCLQLHANYLRLPSGGSITVNRDFENLRLQATDVLAYLSMVKENALTLETMWQRLVEGNILADDFDADEERAKLEAEKEIRRLMAPPVQMVQPGTTVPEPGTGELGPEPVEE